MFPRPEQVCRNLDFVRWLSVHGCFERHLHQRQCRRDRQRIFSFDRLQAEAQSLSSDTTIGVKAILAALSVARDGASPNRGKSEQTTTGSNETAMVVFSPSSVVASTFFCSLSAWCTRMRSYVPAPARNAKDTPSDCTPQCQWACSKVHFPPAKYAFARQTIGGSRRVSL